jgi:hypothetical protein
MPLNIENYSMYDLIPITENFLISQGLLVTVLANKVEATRKTGFFSSDRVVVFFNNYPDGCSITMNGTPSICTDLVNYFKTLPKKEKFDPNVTIKEREIVVMPCPYCRTLVRVTEKRCPHCGGAIV